MDIKLRLGGVLFLFCMECELTVDSEIENFLDTTDETEEIRVNISKKWSDVRLPQTSMSGQDALLEYYIEDNYKFCLTKGGPQGVLACTCYTPDFRYVQCTLNDAPFQFPTKRIGSVLRMLPVREIFLYFHTLFLHASQILYDEKGILFTGASGMGKSTQARLWEKYRRAEIVCNDRTLVRKKNEVWYTHGYPLDGSEPICSNTINKMGCIVVLEQGIRNEVQRLRPGRAISRLLGQTVMDCWNGVARTETIQLIIELLADIPVYLLSCTPDEQAVCLLERKLMEEGVISHGKTLGYAMEKSGRDAFASDGCV